MALVKVEPLPYDYNALEPHIDEQTMRIHHGKHYATYVEKYKPAAVVSPRTPLKCLMIAPAPRKPIPVITPYAIRAGST